MRPTLVLLLAVVTLLPRAAAARSDLHLRDYVHTEWTQHDGIPLGRVSRLLQTTDGRLWIGTDDDGVLRFDGMRFVHEKPPLCTAVLRTAGAAADGGYWGICGERLVRRTPQGQFVEIKGFVPAPDTPTINVDRQGRAWLARSLVQYFEADGRRGPELVRPTRGVIADAALDSDGALWVTDSSQVFRMHEGQSEEVALADARCLTSAREGGVFAIAQGQLWHMRGRSVRPLAASPPGITFGNYGGCMREGRDGVWIATRQHGVVRWQNGRIETMAGGNGEQRQVTEVFIDREATIWFGTTSGLHRIRKPMAQVVSSGSRFQGAPAFAFLDSADAVWLGPVENYGSSRTAPTGERQVLRPTASPYVAIEEDHTGRVWLSNRRDIGYVSGGRFVAVRDSANAPVPGVWSFARDRGGQLFALAPEIGVYCVTPGPPRLVISSPEADARFLVSERFGTWISLSGGGVEQHIDGRRHTFRNRDSAERHGTGPPIGHVQAIVEEGDSIWIGTLSGLRRWRQGHWTDWTDEHGLPERGVVEAIAADRLGRLWMMTRGGILILPREQLDATPDGAPRPLTFARIGLLDGVVPHPGNMRSSPRVSRDRGGRLLFTTMDSVVRVDPSEVTASSLAPPIVIDGVTADNQLVDHGATATLVAPSRLQFDYTSLGLRNPEHARFRYRLEGYDADWIEAGGQRRVTYGTLRTGQYRFTVMGAGGEGVWNETGASFAFQIVPVFWRTWWFGATLIGFGLLSAAGLYQLRVRQLRRQFNLRLEARLAERTRIARDLHDTLVQTVEGSRMVAEQALEDVADHARVARAVEKLAVWLRQASEEGRAAVNSLRATATDTNDLADALRRAIDECRLGSHADISLSVTGDAATLDPLVRDEVFRIGYEGIRNACAHSGGDRIEASLAYGHDLALRISDNGSGIAPEVRAAGKEGHFGLRGMRERAERIGGRFTLVSAPGSGTVITVTIPGPAAYRTAQR